MGCRLWSSLIFRMILKLNPRGADHDLELEPDLATQPTLSMSPMPSSNSLPSTDLHVAVRLLRVAKSFETRIYAKGKDANTNAKYSHPHHHHHHGEEHDNGDDDVKFLHLFTGDAKRQVERCLSWKAIDATGKPSSEYRRSTTRCSAGSPACRNERESHHRQSRGWRSRGNTNSHCLDTGSRHFRRLLKTFRDSKNLNGITQDVNERLLDLSDFPVVSADNNLFLQCKKQVKIHHLGLKQLSRYLAFVNDALAVLHLLRHEWALQRGHARDESLYEENTAADLEHLLLRIRQSLVEAFIGKLAKFVVANSSAWYAEWKQKGKLGGRQWCSEFSNNRRPLSTTWPWSIKPSLAVLWGVCWMFYNSQGQGEHEFAQQSQHRFGRDRGSLLTQGQQSQRRFEQNRDPLSSQGQQSQQGPHNPSHVSRGNFLSDPENARFLNSSFRPEDGAYLAYGQQTLEDVNAALLATGSGDIDMLLSGSAGSDVGNCGLALATDVIRDPDPLNEIPAQPRQRLSLSVGSEASLSPIDYGEHSYLPQQSRQHAEYNASRSPNPSLESPTHFWHQVAGQVNAPAQGQSPFNINAWHQDNARRSQDFQSSPATRAHSPQSSRRSHLIGPASVPVPVPDIRLIPDQSERTPLVTSTAAQAAAPQAYDIYPYATSPQANYTSNLFGAPHSAPGDTTAFIAQHFQQSSQPATRPSTAQMGLHIKQPVMSQDRTRPEPSASEEPTSKRRRISVTSDHPSTTSNMPEELPEESTSPAPSDSISPYGFSPRRGYTFKRDGDPPRNSEGKMVCEVNAGCKNLTFDRKCEWGKHMDKHERPYRCERPECSKLQGFTYSGGLLRHQREVHNMHGGTGKRLFCPEPNCKRHTGSGFTRKENLQEHMRRVHRRTESISEASTTAVAAKTEEEVDGRYSSLERDSHLNSRKSTMDTVTDVTKRKRDGSIVKPERFGDEDSPDSREEIRRLKTELTNRDERNRELEEQVQSQGERLKRLEELLMAKV
ncbi:hypothetical protein NA57DRAFT_50903 [Rhizodiscina lignyota]|uniref:C2H2-type domain-containing protein n=1 Tax=Rhizodiscina lignyota TaxID=1504668 RepID=A0A9P4IRI4_9PEZI|nr:hypothetical protein NA57DRAFT_50903 [Rhizodiscina lignyota]